MLFRVKLFRFIFRAKVEVGVRVKDGVWELAYVILCIGKQCTFKVHACMPEVASTVKTTKQQMHNLHTER